MITRGIATVAKGMQAMLDFKSVTRLNLVKVGFVMKTYEKLETAKNVGGAL